VKSIDENIMIELNKMKLRNYFKIKTKNGALHLMCGGSVLYHENKKFGCLSSCISSDINDINLR
jgi:hypothetical protein